jgi:hypothetical protein
MLLWKLVMDAVTVRNVCQDESLSNVVLENNVSNKTPHVLNVTPPSLARGTSITTECDKGFR